MITAIECQCGNTNPQKAHEYQGFLGYEAIVCLECGSYSDAEGEHDADEWSREVKAEINGEENSCICSQCNGSGEGMWDGSTCRWCKGSGEVRN